ncbi:MAG: ATP synthase F1 subunit epsilon [Verrucomicrobiaceae bacterium]
MSLKLEIVTPEAKVFSDEVTTVVLPGMLGEMGVLPNHAPIVTALIPGELRYTQGNTTTELAIGDGFVEVTASTVKVLTDLAVTEAGIDEATVQAALERAQSRLKDAPSLGAEEIAAVEASIAKSIAQLHLKRKRRSI